MRLIKALLFLCIGFAVPASVFAEAPTEQAPPTTAVDIPLYDAPFNYERGGYSFPSMRQSVALSTGFYENMHRWIGGQPPQDDSWRFFGIVGFDILANWTPLGSSWMHKEWNRAVLTRRDISSYDGTYRFPFFHDVISVDNVSDTDLIRMKKDFPSDQVRMSSAGMESRVAQNLLIERHHFFDGSRTFDEFVLWANALNSTVYLSVCGTNGSNLATQKMRTNEGADIGKRDFTGLDCDAWVYDLFRPDEPYSARGLHPSGVGINRYISHSQLTNQERDFLRRQIFLSLLNFADPFLYGMEGWDGTFFGKEIHWNANIAHTLTSFGYVVDARLFLKHDLENFLITLHNGFGNYYFPGLTVEWLDHPVGDGFSVSTAVTLWSQPRDQRMGADQAQLLADLSTQFAFHWTPATSTYFGVEAKTPGWALGDPYLNANVSVWTGVKTSFF